MTGKATDVLDEVSIEISNKNIFYDINFEREDTS